MWLYSPSILLPQQNKTFGKHVNHTYMYTLFARLRSYYDMMWWRIAKIMCVLKKKITNRMRHECTYPSIRRGGIMLSIIKKVDLS